MIPRISVQLRVIAPRISPQLQAAVLRIATQLQVTVANVALVKFNPRGGPVKGTHVNKLDHYWFT